MQPQPSTANPAPIMTHQAITVADPLADLNKINMDIRGDRVLISGLLDVRGLRLLRKKIESLETLIAPDNDADESSVIVFGDQDGNPA